MIRHEQTQPQENLVYYTYQLFQSFPQVQCITSTRLGGVSEGHLHSLNLSFRVGDDENAVLTNRTRFYNVIDVVPEQVAQAQLVHGSHSEMVTTQSPIGSAYQFPETDGLMTHVPNTALFIPVADCAAVAFFDPKQQVIALVHAGWKGIVNRIVQKIIATMNETYESSPSDILVGISPCLGPCCYQVREDLVDVFTQAFPTQAQQFFLTQSDGTIYLDMWKALRWQLLESGIQAVHLDAADLCTACHTDEFYSHRAEQGKTGRFATLIVLR